MPSLEAYHERANMTVCDYCGALAKMRRNQVYCSNACRQAAYRERNEDARNNPASKAIPRNRGAK